MYALCSEVDEFGFTCFRRVKEILERKSEGTRQLQEACTELSSKIDVTMQDLKQIILSYIDDS